MNILFWNLQQVADRRTLQVAEMGDLGEQLCAFELEIYLAAGGFCGEDAVKQAVGLVDLGVQQERAEQGLRLLPFLVRLFDRTCLDIGFDRAERIVYRALAPHAAECERPAQEQGN